jgi:DnaK suppressor protein
MSHHLTAGQRAMLENTLRLRLQDLLRQRDLHQEGHSRVDHARQVLTQDDDDAPAHASDREVDQSLTDLEQIELREVTRALERVGDAHYGLCEDCSATIPFDRLRLNPAARRCVSCQGAREGSGQPAR